MLSGHAHAYERERMSRSGPSRLAYAAANGPEAEYKKAWIEDIDNGLRAWPKVSHDIALAMVYDGDVYEVDPLVLDSLFTNPAANGEGYVSLPNVDPLIEALDMKQAQRAYEANLNVIETARAMEMRTLDLLKK